VWITAVDLLMPRVNLAGPAPDLRLTPLLEKGQSGRRA